MKKLDIDAAREEVTRFVPDPRMLDAWSEDVFQEAVRRITAYTSDEDG
ncbi:MAG: hypothetical protein GF388_09745 [Candidatus Aegiribacteria sp.]|nr:hypothetical protein [Candidatus Aegiribacteria sp.]